MNIHLKIMKATTAVLLVIFITTLVAAFMLGSGSGRASNHALADHEEFQHPRIGPRIVTRSTDDHDRSVMKARSSGYGKDRVAAIFASPDLVERSRSWLDLLSQLNPNEFVAVAFECDSKRIRDSELEYSQFLYAWGKSDPHAALRYLNEQDPRRIDSFHMRNVYDSELAKILEGWGSTDPQAAIEWVKSKRNGDQKMLATVLIGMSSTSPWQATEELDKLDLSPEYASGVIGAIAPGMAGQGVEVANRWLKSIKEEALHVGAAVGIANHMSKFDPAAAAAWLGSFPNPDIASVSISTVAGNWAKHDPFAAAAWVKTLPNESHAAKAALMVAEGWMNTNLEACVTWAIGLQGQAKDRAISMIIHEYEGEDTDAARQWVSRMTKDPACQEVLFGIITDPNMQRLRPRPVIIKEKTFNLDERSTDLPK